MILVDVAVPVLDEVFDFELDEEVPVNELMKTIVILLAQALGSRPEIQEELYLYALRQECILNPHMTLKQQEIGWGDRLILL